MHSKLRRLPGATNYHYIINGSNKSPRISGIPWIVTHIRIQIHAPIQSNWIERQIPPQPWLVVPMPIIVESGLGIKVLTGQA